MSWHGTEGWGGILWDRLTGFCLFLIFKFLILKHDNAVKLAKMFFPSSCFILGVNFFYFLFEISLIEDNLQP
ncbi:hypothetical protein DFJ74DRAFT_700512 [Hyaloraphidium curvatum]|nr:hypothetical protein DFJ74DRAFT_700512 [Hyaloraphidium curvatum]